MARWLVSLAAVWKVASYDWTRLSEWPYELFRSHRFGAFVLGTGHLDLLWVEALIAIALTLLFAARILTPVTGLLGAFLIAHIGAIHQVVTNHRMMVMYGFGVLFFALFDSHQDDSPGYSAMPLCLLQFYVATTYALVATNRIVSGGFLEWSTGSQLGRILQFEAAMHIGFMPPASEWLLQYPLLLTLAAVTVTPIELSLLVLLVLRKNVTLPILGLALIHLGIYLTMDLFFFDSFLLLATMANWSKLKARVEALRTRATQARP